MYREIYEGRDSELPCPHQACHPPSTSMCSAILQFLEPSTIRIFMKASSHRHDGLLPFPTCLPFLEDMGWGGKFHTSNHSLVFLVTSSYIEVYLEPPHWNKTHLYQSRNSKGLRSLMSDAPCTQDLKTVFGTVDLVSTSNQPTTPVYHGFRRFVLGIGVKYIHIIVTVHSNFGF